MKSSFKNRLFALVMAGAMVITGANTSLLVNANTASAASKVTLKLSAISKTLNEGKSFTLKLTKKNVKKVVSTKWTTSKKAVATVSAKGKVSAKKQGTATIKCKVTYLAKGKAKKQSKALKCMVTVTKASQSEATPAPTPTSKPEVTPGPNPGQLDEKDITLRTKFDDTTNIGEERTVQIVGGTTESMVVKDNGVMRKELSTLELIDTEMGQGINLGNTMEATSSSYAQKLEWAEAGDPTKFEQAWGQPVTTQAYISALHSYGFNTLRVPVAWSSMMAEDGTYKVDERFLGRVEEIVNYALNEGMYVVLNWHWDYGWWGLFSLNEEEAFKRYETVWTQIAERFKDYSDHLVFEGQNEELGDSFTANVYSTGYRDENMAGDDKTKNHGTMTKDEKYALTNKVNQRFVDLIRSTGGNNAYRHLLIPTPSTNIGQGCDERFIMPKDTEENGVSKLSVSVHYYTPWDFCGDNEQGATYEASDRAETEKQFALMKKFTDAGYGIILGEYSVCTVPQVNGGVAQWFNDTMTIAAKYHMLPCMWEIGQYFNRVSGKMKYRDIAELFNTITGSNGDTSSIVYTDGTAVPGADREITFEDVSSLTPAWSWTGKWYKNNGQNIVGDNRYEDGADHTKGTKESDFIPLSESKATIDGDTTALSFNSWGYQAFLKLDLSKYTRPCIAFAFMEGTNTEEIVGSLQFATSAEAGTSNLQNEYTIEYSKWNGKGVALNGELLEGLAKNPYLMITFSDKPTVTGIYVYDLG